MAENQTETSFFPALTVDFKSEVNRRLASTKPTGDPCGRCGLSQNWVLGDGDPAKAKLVFISEYPGRVEVEEKIPQVGASGIQFREVLYDLCDKYGLDKEQIYMTNLLKCLPNDAAIVNGKKVQERARWQACYEKWLSNEIAQLNVNTPLFVLMGRSAISYLLKSESIGKLRGRVYQHKGLKLMPTYNAAYIFAPQGVPSTAAKDDFVRDLELAVKLVTDKVTVEDKEILWPETVEDLFDLTEFLCEQEELTIDYETTDDAGSAKCVDPWAKGARIVMMSVCYDDGKAICIPGHHPENLLPLEACFECMRLIAQSPAKKSNHYIVFDSLYGQVTDVKVPISNITCDSLYDHYCTDERPGIHDLKGLTWKFTEEGGYEEDIVWPIDRNPLHKIYQYGGRDTIFSRQFSRKLHTEIDEQGLRPLHDILVGAVPMLVEMRRFGIFIDQPYKRILVRKLASECKTLDAKMQSEAARFGMKDFDADSHQKVRKLLFGNNHPMCKDPIIIPGANGIFRDMRGKPIVDEKGETFPGMGIPFPEEGNRTDAGYESTDEDTLSRLAGQYEFPKLMLDYRGSAKMLSFIQTLDDWVKSDGLLHPSTSLTDSVTGRSTAYEPAVQTWAKRHDIRALVTSRFENGFILDADYAGAEMRWLAEESQDPVLIEAFKQGQNPHEATGEMIFDVPRDKVRQTLRVPGSPIDIGAGKTLYDVAKTSNFLIVYGGGAWKLNSETGIPLKKCEDILDKYFQRLKGVSAYLARCKKQLHEKGEVVSLLGRKRRLPQIFTARTKAEELRLERQAGNFPIQSIQTDIAMFTATQIQLELMNRGLQSRIVIFLHDSNVLDVHPDEVLEVIDIVRTKMEDLSMFKFSTVPQEAEIKLGPSWGTVRKVIFNGRVKSDEIAYAKLCRTPKLSQDTV